MRYVRFFLISAVTLFLLITLFSLLFPSRVRVSRAVNVSATRAQIWNEIDSMTGWPSWNPFFSELDSAAISKEIKPENSDKSVNLGGTNISWVEKSDSVRMISMERPGRKPVLNAWNVIGHQSTDSLTIHWYMDIQLHWYPWEKFGSLLFEKTYGPELEIGLAQLATRVQFDN